MWLFKREECTSALDSYHVGTSGEARSIRFRLRLISLAVVPVREKNEVLKRKLNCGYVTSRQTSQAKKNNAAAQSKITQHSSKTKLYEWQSAKATREVVASC